MVVVDVKRLPLRSLRNDSRLFLFTANLNSNLNLDLNLKRSLAPL